MAGKEHIQKSMKETKSAVVVSEGSKTLGTVSLSHDFHTDLIMR